MADKKVINLIFGIMAGLIAYAIIGKLGLYLLQVSWADYALHSKDKSYTLTMLFLRLFIGILGAITAGFTATKIANDSGKSAWFVGLIVCCGAAYVHLFKVWNDYPTWYHLAYLLSIIPITVLSHYVFAKRN